MLMFCSYFQISFCLLEREKKKERGNYVNRLSDGKAKNSSLFTSIKIAPSALDESKSSIKLLPLS